MAGLSLNPFPLVNWGYFLLSIFLSTVNQLTLVRLYHFLVVALEHFS